MKTGELTKQFRFLALSLFVAAAMLAGCESAPPQVSIEGAKAALSPAIVGEAMVTMNIRNQGGTDVVKAVRTDIPGANASLHVMEGKRMVSVETVKVPAKRGLEFKMGGSHIMIENMPKTMKEGSKFNLTLIFEKSGEKQLPLTLQPAGTMPMGHDHQM